MIYTITVFDSRHRTRCVGYTLDLETAQSEIECNAGDMHEGSNIWAVIEFFTPGVYVVCKGERWYKWSLDREQYEHCVKPTFSDGLTNWGMG